MYISAVAVYHGGEWIDRAFSGSGGGVKVPGYQRYSIAGRTWREKFQQVWYADDAAFFAGSSEKLQLMMNISNDYLSSHGLKINEDKSVVVRFGTCKEKDCKKVMTMNGKEIVDKQEFTHLGMLVSRVHTISRMAQARLKCAKNSLQKVSIWFQKYSKISDGMKLQYMNAQIMSVALYGVPMWAANKTAVEGMNTLVARWTRRLCGLHYNANTGLTILETNGVLASVEARRRQLKWMFANLNHPIRVKNQQWIRQMIRTAGGRMDSWMGEAISWCQKELDVDITVVDQWQTVEEKIDIYTRETASSRYGTQSNVDRYMNEYYKDAVWNSKFLLKRQNLRRGQRLWMQLRIGNFWSSKLIRTIELNNDDGLVQTVEENQCLFCGEENESIEHLLVSCKKWKEVRNRHWSDKSMEWMLKTSEDKTRFILHGGNETNDMIWCITYLQDLEIARCISKGTILAERQCEQLGNVRRGLWDRLE